MLIARYSSKKGDCWEKPLPYTNTSSTHTLIWGSHATPHPVCVRSTQYKCECVRNWLFKCCLVVKELLPQAFMLTIPIRVNKNRRFNFKSIFAICLCCIYMIRLHRYRCSINLIFLHCYEFLRTITNKRYYDLLLWVRIASTMIYLRRLHLIWPKRGLILIKSTCWELGVLKSQLKRTCRIIYPNMAYGEFQRDTKWCQVLCLYQCLISKQYASKKNLYKLSWIKLEFGLSAV